MDKIAPRTASNNDGRVNKKFNRLFKLIAKSDKIYLVWAFFIPFLLMWLIYIAMEVFPFGYNSVLVLDLNGQYVSFFENLHDMIRGEGGIIYSWERALGGEYMGIYAYYLASPLSFIVGLFPKRMITEALLLIILTKAGLCGLTMGYYLHTAYPSKKINAVIFSTLYALNAYAVVQSHNTMWIDELIILPLLVLGIDRIISRRDFVLYTAALALALIVNFYIGFMMCIFTLFYFFYSYFANNYDNRGNIYGERFHFIRSLARIGLFTAIAVAMAAVILLPAYYSLTFGKNTFSDPSYAFEQNFDFLDMLVKLYPGSYDTVRPEGLPFLYSGTATMILLPIFFISKKIKPREKLLGGLALIFLAVCFNGSTIDLIWHGFQRPNWLNYRYSFIFCFFIVMFAYRAFAELERIDFKWVVLSFFGWIAMLLIIQKAGYEFVSDLRMIWVSIACLAGNIVGLYTVSKQSFKRMSTLVMAILVCVELFAAGLLNMTSLDSDVVFTSRNTYRTYMDKLTPIISEVKDSDYSFYRMEKTLHRKTNDPMALGYRGASNSTSTLNASVIELLNRLGLTSRSHWSKYIGGTPVTDSLLGFKYIINESDDAPFYNKVSEDLLNELFAFENPYCLSIAYAVDDAIKELDITKYASPFLLLNDIVGHMLGEERGIDLFKKLRIKDIEYDNCDITYVTGHKKYSPEIDYRDAKIHYVIEAKTDDYIYCFFETDYPRECSLTLNGIDAGYIMGNDSDCIKTLGSFTQGEELFITLKLNEDVMYLGTSGDTFYYLDSALFEEVMPKLAKSLYNVETHSDTKLSGTITVADNMTTLFTTIPYDEGWKVTIDGEHVELIRVLDSLIAVEISPGEHYVVFEYKPLCVTLGLIISAAGLSIYILCTVLFFFRKKKRKLLLASSEAVIDAENTDGILIADVSSENIEDDTDTTNSETDSINDKTNE